MNEHLPANYLGRKFTTLRVLAVLLKVVGVLVGLVPIVITAITFRPRGFLAPALPWGNFTFVIALLYGLVIALSFFALSEIILVLLSTEENTRRTAFYTHQVSAGSGQGGVAPLLPAGTPTPVGLEDIAQQLQTLTTQVTILNEAVTTMAQHTETSTETMQAIAESSRATATLLHRQQGK